MSIKKLGIVIPAYNEARMIYNNMSKLSEILLTNKIDFSVVLVDDGSKDSTWDEMIRLTHDNPRFRAIRFSRNFGKEAAICAGLREVPGDYVLIMDSDLQHPPRYIVEMISLLEASNADIVDGIKTSRGRENIFYKLCAKTFYGLFKKSTSIDLQNSSDFKLMRRSVVDEINTLEESNVFFRGLVSWIGFKRVPFPFSVDNRIGDKSRFSVSKLAKLSMNAILSYTSKPLYLTIFLGALFLLFSVIIGIQTLYNYFSGNAVSGFTTVILLLLFIGSILLFSIGIVGIYVARIYDEVKRRPQYIVSERT